MVAAPCPPPLPTSAYAERTIPCLAALRPTIGPPPPEIDGRVLSLTLLSSALGTRKTLYVYLPPGYRRGTTRYPVLYLLRGHEREWVHPHEDASRCGTVIDVYLRLLASGRIGPMILVFPGLTSDDGSVHGLAVNFRARALAPDLAGVGSGHFESYLCCEVVPTIDALFPTLPGARHRGVDGFSLGGFMAVKVALQGSDLFRSVGAYDGTFLYADAAGDAVAETDAVYRNALFDPAFGQPRDGRYAAANSPATLLLRTPPAYLRRLQWLIQYGPQAEEPMNANYYRGAYLNALLTARGVSTPLPPVIADGAHTWAIADRHMEATLPLHWQRLH